MLRRPCGSVYIHCSTRVYLLLPGGRTKIHTLSIHRLRIDSQILYLKVTG